MGKIVDVVKGTLVKRFSPAKLVNDHKDKVISIARDEAHSFAMGFVKKQLLMVNFIIGVTSFIAGGIVSYLLFV